MQEIAMATVIKRKKSPYWYMKFIIRGRQYLLSTKETDKRKAKTMLEETVVKLRRLHQQEKLTERVFEALNKQERRKLPIKDVWKNWEKNPKRDQQATTTIKDHKIFWSRFEEWAQHTKLEYLHQVTPNVAKEFMRFIWDRGISQNRYNKYRNFLRMIWRAVSDLAGIEENPWDKVETLSQDTRSKRELSEKELKLVIEKANEDLRPLLLIGAYTGLRFGDACTLKWAEIDLKGNQIVRVENKKKSKGRPVKIPIHPDLKTVLLNLRTPKSNEDYVLPIFASQYQSYPDQLTRTIQKHFQSCGIETQELPTKHRKNRITVVGFHSLRHSFVSLCAQKGVPEVALMELVGHGSPAMTRHYSHAGKETKVSAIKSLPHFVKSSEKSDGGIQQKSQGRPAGKRISVHPVE
jgi:integrase